jgi:hypothetical protein
MNRVILVVFTVVLSASLAFAQDTQSSSGDSNSIAGNFSLRTFRGCLSQTGNQYVLAVGGVAPRQYRLAGSNLAQLDGKAGHMVSITGTMPDSFPVGSTSVNTESDTINFLSVDDLASTCKASSDQGPAADTPYSRAAAIASAQKQSLMPFVSFILEPESRPGSFMIVPLVGVLALGLLQAAHYRRRK